IALEAFKVGAHFGRALGTQVSIFLESLVNDVVQLGRNGGLFKVGRYRGAVSDGVEEWWLGLAQVRRRDGGRGAQKGSREKNGGCVHRVVWRAPVRETCRRRFRECCPDW